MNDRTDFNKIAEEILSFMDSYVTVKFNHLEKFFPGSVKAINYLIKNKRLHSSSDGIYIGIDPNLRPDKALIAALSMLSELLPKVKDYTKATAPAQLSFTTQHTGEHYEIIYVAHGMETMIAEMFEVSEKTPLDIIKRIVIVEDKVQMQKLQIPGTTRFALVLPNGQLTYYKI